MRTSRFPSEPLLCRSVLTLGILLLFTAGAWLVITTPAEAKRADEKPPSFAGLKSATTCIPGPVGGGSTAAYSLKWDRATDDVSPSKKIVYDVYQANTTGGEDFTNRPIRRPPASPPSQRLRSRPARTSTSSSAPGTKRATGTQTRWSERAKTFASENVRSACALTGS
jgi:hypothetical protein